MVLPKKTKTYATLLSPEPRLDHLAPVICSGFPHVSSALVMRIQLQTLQEGDTQFTTCRKYRIQQQNLGFGMSPLKFSMKQLLTTSDMQTHKFLVRCMIQT